MAEPQKQITPFQQFKSQLIPFKDEVKKLLPEHITVERFERVVLSAINNNPYLLELDRKSLFESCLKCASDGLIPDGREAALVPFKDKVQYMPMVYGIIKKIRNSGELKSLTVNLVHKNDKFKYFVNENGETLLHEPDLFSDRGDLIGVYSIIKTKYDAFYLEVMTKNEVMAVKAMAEQKLKDKSKSPWNGVFFAEMWKKTVIRRQSKRVPMSAEVEKVIQANDDMLDFNDVPRISKADEVAKLISQSTETIDPVTSIESEVPQAEQKTEDKGSFANFNPQAIK